jgi:2,4-dienoyl-CoA reductase-like NADH-dependent reductase (Old Yellow Enzyme family)
MSSNRLFSALTLRGLTIKNRAWVSPMCQYSCDKQDGVPTDWHYVHLATRAVGGAGLVCVEATAVEPEGRISPQDTGLWNLEQQRAWARITACIRSHGAVPAIQLAHAGRKASTEAPWVGNAQVPLSQGGWTPIAPSPLPFHPTDVVPAEMSVADIARVTKAFVDAATRALEAGFDVVELHFAHGYLAHEFLSPLSNQRTDSYGGSFENRTRFALEVTRAVRAVWPEDKPLFARISATDWAEGGWDASQSVKLAGLLKAAGVDLVDCSSGGAVPSARIPVGPGYQVPLAAAVRAGAGVPTAAVGMITEAVQAEQILVDGSADAIFMARELLRNPYWPLQAAQQLRVADGKAAAPGSTQPAIAWPDQYARAKPFPRP